MTDIGKRLFDNLPPKFNRNGEILNALIANNEGTGALEKMFLYGDTVKENYAKADNVYEMASGLIDQTMDMFSFFERFYNESDGSFVKRNKSIFVRGGDITFGTAWNVQHVFEYYFPAAKIFLVDNIGRWTENILVNSNFESDLPSEIAKWTMTGCVLNKDGAFSGGKGVYFTSNGIVSQSAMVDGGKYYFVTCAVNGHVTINVTDKSGNNKTLYTIGEKINGSGGSGRSVDTENWRFIQMFFFADKTEELKISISGDKDSKVDLITLDKKKDYPCFVVYAWFDGVMVGGKTLHLSKSGEDPIPGINYNKESYFDDTFFSGVSGNTFAADIYQDILNMVKAAGTKGDIVLLTKEAA